MAKPMQWIAKHRRANKHTAVALGSHYLYELTSPPVAYLPKITHVLSINLLTASCASRCLLNIGWWKQGAVHKLVNKN